ncbi:MAG TPA: MFS transporter [Stellaceae bacterium]|jgi:AAHS family 4-hydroxybenzoate transporter-like MFS transporter|nr:MFS transporter [Stellaceae bacterium]
MASEETIEIGQLVETQRLNAFHLYMVVLGCLILTVDGMDFASANVAAPQILKALGASRAAMGQVFASGNFGILIGSLTFGFIGDIYGRKNGAIFSIFVYSLPAVAVAFASSMDHLIYLRFLAGLGIGGVIPNVVALLNETAPKKFRATFVLLGFVGYSLGSSISGWVASHFIPSHGWQIPFIVAGCTGVTLAIILYFILPESVRFLTLREPDSARTRATVKRIAPGAAISPFTRFTISVPPAGKYSIRELFADDRRVVTPLLWLGYFAESLTFMTMLSWMTTILTDAGVPQSQAPLAYAWGAMGGLCAMVLLAPLIDRFGQLATVGTAIIAMVAILVLGANVSIGTHIAMAMLAFTTCQVTHNSLNATVASFYPTNIRAKGIGWASGCGRVALTLGPLVTGYLLAAHLPTSQVTQLIAAPYAVVTCTCLALGLIYRARLRRGGVEMTAAMREAS